MCACIQLQHHDGLILSGLVRVEGEGICALCPGADVGRGGLFYRGRTEVELCLVVGCGEGAGEIVRSPDGYRIGLIHLGGRGGIHPVNIEAVGSFQADVFFDRSCSKRHAAGAVRKEAFARHFNLIG